METPSSRLFLGMIPWYGVLIVLGAALAILLADREANRLLLPRDTIIDLAFWVLPLGIIGARIYYVIFSWPTFAGDPVSVLYLWQGGLAIFGGLIAGLLTVFLFCRRRKLALPMMLDILVPGVALAQAIGRWGNYFNQEAYGLPLPAESPLAFFPLAVVIQTSAGPEWHLATFFYESLLDFLIFLFLITGRRKWFRSMGDAFFFYLLLYAAGRLIIERLRMDSLYMGSSIRVSQLLSILLCLSVLVVFISRRRKRGGMRTMHWLLSGAALIAGIAALTLSLRLPVVRMLSVRSELLLLGLFSLLIVLSSLIIYGPSHPSEVCYADHPG